VKTRPFGREVDILTGFSLNAKNGLVNMACSAKEILDFYNKKAA